MGTTADKLAKLAETKEAIRIAINDKGVEVSKTEPFASYPEKIASIEGGGGTSLFNISLTLDGATNTITKGATITITDNATGEAIVKTWEGGMIQVAVPSLAEYTIKCSKIIGYSSPKKVVFIPSKDVSYDYTFNYITPPVGVYLLTTDDELIAPADWKSTYDCVGVYVGFINHINIPYRTYVLAPEAIDVTNGTIKSSNFDTVANALEEEVRKEYDNYIFYQGAGLINTRYLYGRYNIFGEAWNYEFKNGAQGFVASYLELLQTIAMNSADIITAYETIGVALPYTISYLDNSNWSVYSFQTSTPCDNPYGWKRGHLDVLSRPIADNNATTTIPFSVY